MRDLASFRLREMGEADLEQVLIWRNSDRIRVNMYTDGMIPLEQHRAWFASLKQKEAPLPLIFEIEGVPSGVMNFTGLDAASGRCDWGFYLGRTDLPAGTGTIMGYLGLMHAFEQMSIRKLCGEVFGFNRPSMRFHEKLGFSCEGTRVKHFLRNGQYEDIVYYAQFSEAWTENKQRIEQLIRNGSSS